VLLQVRVELSGDHLFFGCRSFVLGTLVGYLKDLLGGFLVDTLQRLNLSGLWSEGGLHLDDTLADVAASSKDLGFV
jgi:hypothetical protein